MNHTGRTALFMPSVFGQKHQHELDTNEDNLNEYLSPPDWTDTSLGTKLDYVIKEQQRT